MASIYVLDEPNQPSHPAKNHSGDLKTKGIIHAKSGDPYASNAYSHNIAAIPL